MTQKYHLTSVPKSTLYTLTTTREIFDGWVAHVPLWRRMHVRNPVYKFAEIRKRHWAENISTVKCIVQAMPSARILVLQRGNHFNHCSLKPLTVWKSSVHNINKTPTDFCRAKIRETGSSCLENTINNVWCKAVIFRQKTVTWYMQFQWIPIVWNNSLGIGLYLRKPCSSQHRIYSNAGELIPLQRSATAHQRQDNHWWLNWNKMPRNGAWVWPKFGSNTKIPSLTEPSVKTTSCRSGLSEELYIMPPQYAGASMVANVMLVIHVTGSVM